MPQREKVQQQKEDEFWKEHYPKLQRYCYFLAQNRWDGDDIAHETFLKALKYPNLNSALLNKIAYNHLVDTLRKRKHETLDLEKITFSIDYNFETITDAVAFLLQKFTPKQAIVFLLKEAFQYQIKEIASLLETTEMAVKAILNRARKCLEKDFSLDSFWEEEERERLSDLFYEALKSQDPTVLIVSIPTIHSLQTVPKGFAPSSSTLYMAA
jgi:RNA polymerase sigma factor (sigma-70 family)